MNRNEYGNTERDFAVKHAKDAYRISKDYGCDMPGLSLVWEGYRFDDDNGISVFLDYDGNMKGSANDLA